MAKTSRDRKTRGGQIRTSRDEKSRRKRERLGIEPRDADGAEESMSARAAHVPDPEPFVETEAVADVKRRIGRWLAVDRPVHLVGPTGCGKTAVAVSAARERDRPVVFVNGDAEMETSDLVGEYGGEERYSVSDKYVHNVHKRKDVVRDRWIDNPLTVAVREGATLVYNEFSRTKPAANNVLLSVFEEGVLELPGRRGEDRYVEVHPEFRAILTSNSVEYAGVHEPQDALLDRLVGIHTGFYDAETETEIVAAHTDLPEAQASTLVGTMRALREELSITVGTRAAIMAAEAMAVAEEPTAETIAEIVVDVLSSKVPHREGVADLRVQVADVLGVTE